MKAYCVTCQKNGTLNDDGEPVAAFANGLCREHDNYEKYLLTKWIKDTTWVSTNNSWMATGGRLDPRHPEVQETLDAYADAQRNLYRVVGRLTALLAAESLTQEQYDGILAADALYAPRTEAWAEWSRSLIPVRIDHILDRIAVLDEKLTRDDPLSTDGRRLVSERDRLIEELRECQSKAKQAEIEGHPVIADGDEHSAIFTTSLEVLEKQQRADPTSRMYDPESLKTGDAK